MMETIAESAMSMGLPPLKQNMRRGKAKITIMSVKFLYFRRFSNHCGTVSGLILSIIRTMATKARSNKNTMRIIPCDLTNELSL